MFFLSPIFQLIDLVLQLLFWGFVVLVIVFIVRALSDSEPKEDQVIERWSALLPGQVKSGKEYFDLVETELVTRGLPYKGHAATLGGGLLSAGSPALRIVFNPNYSCYVSYEEIGSDLHVTWVLYEKIHWFYSVPVIGPIFYRWWNVVTIHDRNRLLAFASFTKSCVESVVDSLFEKYNLDKNKIVREASGKLGPL